MRKEKEGGRRVGNKRAVWKEYGKGEERKGGGTRKGKERKGV